MPIVFRQDGFRFFFYSNEGNPREPLHIHVTRGGGEAKLWIRADVTIAYNDGLNARDLATVMRLAEANREIIEEGWTEFFG
jgi:uncharacterized protein DUF4160